MDMNKHFSVVCPWLDGWGRISDTSVILFMEGRGRKGGHKRPGHKHPGHNCPGRNRPGHNRPGHKRPIAREESQIHP